jgi:hypothetical protein
VLSALVIGAVPGREVAQGAEQVGNGSAAGDQRRADRERRESLVGGTGEVEGRNLDRRVRIGW